MSRLLEDAAQWMAYRPSSSFLLDNLGSFWVPDHQPLRMQYLVAGL